jgi:hypothetical protein
VRQLGQFSNSRALFSSVQGGFFSRKKPLGFEVSVKSRIENAVAPEGSAPESKMQRMKFAPREKANSFKVDGSETIYRFLV